MTIARSKIKSEKINETVRRLTKLENIVCVVERRSKPEANFH